MPDARGDRLHEGTIRRRAWPKCEELIEREPSRRVQRYDDPLSRQNFSGGKFSGICLSIRRLHPNIICGQFPAESSSPSILRSRALVQGRLDADQGSASGLPGEIGSALQLVDVGAVTDSILMRHVTDPCAVSNSLM
jgi:hypothetical protein